MTQEQLPHRPADEGKSSIYISVVVPVMNEEENVEIVCDSVRSVLNQHSFTYEIVLVDDGSSDRTWTILERVARVHSDIKAIKFRRNYGQTAAMAAGIRHASGKVIVTMDGDLQNDPRDIPHLIQRIEEGYDIVVGWRHARQDESLRVLISKAANWLIAKVAGVPVHDLGCSLKAYRADLIRSVPLYSDMHRFIPVITSIVGARLDELKVRHHARQFGSSKYGFSRILKVASDIVAIRFILSFVRNPILWAIVPVLLAIATGLPFLVVSAVHGWMGNSDSVVLLGIGLLAWATAAFLFIFSLVGYLIVLSSAKPPFAELAQLSGRLQIGLPSDAPPQSNLFAGSPDPLSQLSRG